jgi:hypothetical protein
VRHARMRRECERRWRRRARWAAFSFAATILTCAAVAANNTRDLPDPTVFFGHEAPKGRPGVDDGSHKTPMSRRSVPAETGGVTDRRPRARAIPVPRAASGRYAVVRGEARPPRGSRGTVIRYLVEVERGLPFRGAAFAAAIHRILNDPRSWGSGGRLRFERTDHGSVPIRVSLSSPALAARQCLPLDTGGRLSCWNNKRAIINATRWARGAATYGRDLASYRKYVINHEVGHGLGHHHVACPGAGKPAPVMAQQTKSLDGCRRNPWPYRGRGGAT